MNNLAIERIRAAIEEDLGPEPARCRSCATWVSRRGIPAHVAVIACSGAACQREGQEYAARLEPRRAA